MQNTVNDRMAVGLPGGLYGIGPHNIISRNNYSKKLDKVTIDADDTTTVVTVNSTAYTFTESGASELKATIAEYLTGLINAGALPVTAYYTATNDYFTIESDVSGTTTTVVGTTSCTVVAQIGNAAAINFGLFVCQDQEDDEKARVPIVTTDVSNVLLARGIVVHNQAVEQFYQSAGGAGYALNAEMPIINRGMVWVVPETTMAITDEVFARFTVSGVTVLGGIRNDADSGKAVAIPYTRVVRSSAAAALCLIDINLP